MTVLRFGCAWLIAGLLACAGSPSDPLGRHNSLEQSQRRYTQLVRWGEFERASDFVEADLREEFLSHASAFENIRITDFDISPPKFEDDATVIVTVTYHAYSLTSFTEKKIRERQAWFRDEGLKNTWTVRPELQEIVKALHPAQI